MEIYCNSIQFNLIVSRVTLQMCQIHSFTYVLLFSSLKLYDTPQRLRIQSDISTNLH